MIHRRKEKIMYKCLFSITATFSILLYAVLGYMKEVFEKSKLVSLMESQVDFANDVFILNVSFYLNILLIVAGLSIVLTLCCFAYDIVSKKKTRNSC